MRKNRASPGCGTGCRPDLFYLGTWRSILLSDSVFEGHEHVSVGTGQAEQQERKVRVGLLAGAVLCLVASGGLLWWRYGGAVFNDLVLTTLAWCF